MTDERDIRDPALDAAWRAHSTETPPPAIDTAILAAAHRAVKSGPEKIGPGREATRPWRWWTPLAAAAVIGVIAIGVLQLLPQEPDATKAVVSDAPASLAAKQSPEPAASPAASVASQAPTVNGAPVAASLEERTAPAAPAPAASPPAQRQERTTTVGPSRASSDAAANEAKVRTAPRSKPEAFPARRDAESGDARGSAPAPASQSRAAPSLAAPAQESASAPVAAGALPAPALAKRAVRDQVSAQQRSPDDFIARIRALFTEGNVAEAQRELVAFRSAYPDADARLPTDLRPWAASVPRN